MEPALTGSVDKLLERGLSGLVIIALAFIAWRLWLKLNEVQEKRLAEVRENLEALQANTIALDKLAIGVSAMVNARRDQ